MRPRILGLRAHRGRIGEPGRAVAGAELGTRELQLVVRDEVGAELESARPGQRLLFQYTTSSTSLQKKLGVR